MSTESQSEPPSAAEPRPERDPAPPLIAAEPVRDYEAELREQEELHRLACEAGRTGSWYVRLDTRECTFSPMAAALLGLPAEKLTIPAERWQRRIDRNHLEGLEAVVRAAIADEAPFAYEFKAARGDGTEYWLHLRGEVVRDASGQPVRVHGAVVDLTEHKRAKDALRQLNETLELRVAERTEALMKAQDALRQSQKLEAMGQLTGGIAHDFNNLLTPIIANLDLLRQHVAGERERRLVDGALRSAGSAQTLVQRLLAFARRQELRPTRIALPALVEGMADLIRRALGPKIRIELDLAGDLDPALADGNQLEMAILNLSVNARDAMPDGGTLTLKAANDLVGPDHETRLAPGRYVRVSIADTGIGMDEETRERAVEPFFSTKRAGEGTGLGLSMVDGLASQMGGAFRLSSERGRGTTATLWLPAWAGPADVEEPEAAIGAAGAHGGVALVVDDHDLVRASTAEMLVDLGYQVVEAQSGEEAARLVADGLQADLMVTDQLMPGMSGSELTALVRRRLPDLPVLLVSGYSDPNGVPQDLPCLTKPFRRADLAAQVARLRRVPAEADA